ncbi:MAG: M20/M25/M40 family metallo-hydrolase [Planctomycetes bacterium]|nr:M20/M25/M40 family metallo-hydrolase [Planctomycetota bacterium]
MGAAMAMACAWLLAQGSAPSQAESPWLDDKNLGAPLRPGEVPPLAEPLLDVAAKLVGRALVSNRAMATLEELCDDCGPRLSGSAGADLAVEWCLERLRADGFDDVHAEKVMVPRWVRGDCKVAMTGPRAQELAACALGGSVGTGGRTLTAPVIATPSLETLAKLSPADVRGKIVLLTRKMERDGGSESGYGPTVSIRGGGAVAAAKLGAVAVMIRSVGTGNARLPHTGAMRYEEGVAKIPAVALSAEDAELLDRLLARGRDVSVSLALGCETLPDVESANVIAELRGREKPEEIVVIGGHLDSWDLGSGAIDDGAGCVIAWEALRLFRELGLRPRRTVRLVLFMNEENGSRGGESYFADHRDEMGRTVAAIESDSGAGRPLGFGCTSSDGDLARVQQLGALLSGIGANAVTKGGGGVDIGPMRGGGVPTLGLRQDSHWYFDYHHTPADTPDKVDPHELALNVAAMAVMAYALAELEPRLANYPQEAETPRRR